MLAHTRSYPLTYPSIPRPYRAQSSFVHWCLGPATKPLVFVHGLGGAAQRTRGLDLFRQLRAAPKLTQYDIFSISYDSFRPALISTNELFAITQALLEEPETVYKKSIEDGEYVEKPQQRNQFSYSSVIFVCHSLGAL